jgi:hypothetical protein
MIALLLGVLRVEPSAGRATENTTTNARSISQRAGINPSFFVMSWCRRG